MLPQLKPVVIAATALAATPTSPEAYRVTTPPQTPTYSQRQASRVATSQGVPSMIATT